MSRTFTALVAFFIVFTSPVARAQPRGFGAREVRLASAFATFVTDHQYVHHGSAGLASKIPLTSFLRGWFGEAAGTARDLPAEFRAFLRENEASPLDVRRSLARLVDDLEEGGRAWNAYLGADPGLDPVPLLMFIYDDENFVYFTERLNQKRTTNLYGVKLFGPIADFAEPARERAIRNILFFSAFYKHSASLAMGVLSVMGGLTLDLPSHAWLPVLLLPPLLCEGLLSRVTRAQLTDSERYR